jgi:hypothetical protein
MVKVEQGLLVVDSTLSKEDVEAINRYVAIAEKRETDRIIAIVRQVEFHGQTHSVSCLQRHEMAQDIVDAIEGKTIE